MFIKAKCVLGIKTKDGRSPIYPGSVAEVDDRDGKLMVERGVAEKINASPKNRSGNISAGKTPSENPPKDENAQNEPSTPENDEGTIKGNLAKDDLEAMSYTQLKELAKDMGIETGKIKSKEAMIEAICSVEVTADADDVVETGEEPPTFDAQEVVE